MTDTADSAAAPAIRPESRLVALLAIGAVISLQIAIPERYTAVPRIPMIALESLLIVVILVSNPLTAHRWTVLGTWSMRLLIGAITLDNTLAAIVLDWHIINGEMADAAPVLLGSGAAVYLTNVIAFGLWYWALDRGGPAQRAAGTTRYPAFQFPQMTSPPGQVRPGWRPMCFDYLYVGFTNSIAFSPTDTMPLARWAKAMMIVQSLVATTTIALVFARAVSVLK